MFWPAKLCGMWVLIINMERAMVWVTTFVFMKDRWVFHGDLTLTILACKKTWFFLTVTSKSLHLIILTKVEILVSNKILIDCFWFRFFRTGILSGWRVRYPPWEFGSSCTCTSRTEIQGYPVFDVWKFDVRPHSAENGSTWNANQRGSTYPLYISK